MAINSGLVYSETYYLAQNPDVAAAIGVLQSDGVTLYTSGKQHFEAYGAAEGRSASPLFDVEAYKANNPDLAEAGLTTTEQLRAHFNVYGAAEGRNALSSQVFNLDYYKANNADLVELGLSDAQLVRHFYEYGAQEGRLATVNFSVAAYKAGNPDLAGLSDAVARGHWYIWGAQENRAFPQLAQTFTVAAASNTVTEGNALTFTVTSALPVTADTAFTYNITGDTNNGTLTASKAEDFASLTGVVTIPAGATSITFTVTPTNDNTAEGLEGFRISLFNSGLTVVAQSNVVAIQDGIGSVTRELTASIDGLTGNVNNDTFTAGATTLSVFDTLDGAAGTDTLNVTGAGNVDTTALTGLTVKNIEIVNFTLSDAKSTVTADTTGWTGVTTVNATVGAKAALTLADTTDATVTVSDIDVTDGAVAITGGRNVTITTVSATTDASDTKADITVSKATGTVNVTATTKLAATGDGVDVSVTGGTTVNVTHSATQSTVSNTTTQGNTAVTGTAVTTAVTVTQSAVVAADGKTAGVDVGDVTVTDVNASEATKAGTISTVTLTNFGTATLDSSALTTVNAAGTGTALNIGRGALTATPTANTLNLNLNGLTVGTVTDTEAAADDGFTTLAITTASGNSKITTLEAADATTITVGGNKNLTITTLTAGALTSVTNSGTGAVSIGSTLGNGVLYTGGTGADSIAVGATTKAITTGEGDDTITVGVSALGTGGSINAGGGTDTLAMSGANAATASGNATFQGTIEGFERLSLTDLTGDHVVNLANLDALNHVTLGAVSATKTTTLTGATSGLTLVANSSSAGTIIAQLSADSTNDSVSVNVSDKSSVTHAAVTLTGYENVTFNTDDSNTTPDGTVNHVITTLTNTTAKSITVIGDAGLTLGTGFTGTALTSFDASQVTKGNVSYTTGALAAAATLSGGAGNDTLVASSATKSVTINGNAGNDTLTGSATAGSALHGGAGNDTLTGGAAADTIDGGEGNDMFVFSSANVVEQAGASTTTGVVINLSADTLTQSAVFTSTGAYLASTAPTVAAGSATYLYNSESSTNAVVVDTLLNIESATGTDLADYLVGSAGANSLVGGAGADTITGGEGADTITGGAGNDTIILTESTAAIDHLVVLTGADLTAVGTNNGVDTVTGFAAGAGGDVIDLSALSTLTTGAAAVFGTVTATGGNPATAGTNVLVLDDSTPGLLAADATALANLATTFGANVQSSTIVIVYAGADNGAARVALATIDAGGDITAATDLFVLTGVDVDNVTVANFTLA